jgi:hypothetical protein
VTLKSQGDTKTTLPSKGIEGTHRACSTLQRAEGGGPRSIGGGRNAGAESRGGFGTGSSVGQFIASLQSQDSVSAHIKTVPSISGWRSRSAGITSCGSFAIASVRVPSRSQRPLQYAHAVARPSFSVWIWPSAMVRHSNLGNCLSLSATCGDLGYAL